MIQMIPRLSACVSADRSDLRASLDEHIILNAPTTHHQVINLDTIDGNVSQPFGSVL